jgi:hypothetical protein
MKRAKTELPKDDQRRISLGAAESFSSAFPASLDAMIKLSNDEFTSSFHLKLGILLRCLWLHVGEPIATNGNSHRLRVDPFGSNAAAAPGAGDQARTTHDAFVTKVVRLVKEAGIPACGGGCGSVKGIFRPEQPPSCGPSHAQQHHPRRKNRRPRSRAARRSPAQQTLRCSKTAFALDTKYPGSTVLTKKKKYGEGG